MGDFESDTLRDSIVAGWGLSGTVAKAGSAASGVYPVYILAHNQSTIQEISTRKAVEVRKTSPIENIVTHPRFSVINDTFEISCHYELADSDEVVWDAAEADIEDMCNEVIRIVETVYDPSAGTGIFFTTSRNWSNQDDLRRTGDPILKRVLLLTLSKITSADVKVFEGFGGVLTFDLSASANMDSAPGGDVIYTAAHNVRIGEGYSVTEHMNHDAANSERVPKLGVGRFRGNFSAQIFADADDIGSTTENLNKIYLLSANGQHVEATFLHALTNNNSETLTQTSFVKVVFMEKTTSDEELVAFNVTGRLIKPSTMAVA